MNGDYVTDIPMIKTLILENIDMRNKRRRKWSILMKENSMTWFILTEIIDLQIIGLNKIDVIFTRTISNLTFRIHINNKITNSKLLPDKNGYIWFQPRIFLFIYFLYIIRRYNVTNILLNYKKTKIKSTDFKNTHNHS